MQELSNYGQWKTKQLIIYGNLKTVGLYMEKT